MSAGMVGIVGVGALGSAIAERLIAAGFEVAGYRRGPLVAFVAAGGVARPSATSVVADGRPVLLLLPNDDALAEVMAEIAPALGSGQILLCLGTRRLLAKEAAAEQAHAAGAILLDGEVSGTPAMLRAGQASVMLAGDGGAIARVRAVTDGFARATSDLGGFGNATKMKLVTNYLVGVHTLAAAEALLFARTLGLDLPTTVATIGQSAGGSTMLAVRGRMIAEDAIPAGDMRGFTRFFDLLRDALAAAGGAPGPLLDLTESLYRRAIAAGLGDRDIAAVARSLGER